MKIAFAFCGSFCTHREALACLEELVLSGVEATPVFSERVQTTDTRFGKAADLINYAETICGKNGIKTIVEAEKEITGGGYDCVAVAPCTGNTLAKIALGVTDTAVTMAVKAHLRNKKPLLIAFASNDALSGNLKNIAAMLEKKNVYFVPMKQDDPVKKPTSLVCDWSKLGGALQAATEGKQLHPLIVV
ncbi:MAG: dipicolinate synthase subunit B [Clostridia bacterium]|nr:dipicolinate synthase subunit B [Clostridia bacterium]